MSAAATGKPSALRLRRLFRRGPWEGLATALIGLGVVMLCQPFLLVLYTYSFVTILTGTVLFAVVSKFPD
jgi:hypothetical protein